MIAKSGDDGSNDLIVSEVIRRNELQVWFVAEHVVPLPLAQTKQGPVASLMEFDTDDAVCRRPQSLDERPDDR